MQYLLEPPFASISGVVTRKTLPNGTKLTLIAKKDGTLYWRRNPSITQPSRDHLPKQS